MLPAGGCIDRFGEESSRARIEIFTDAERRQGRFGRPNLAEFADSPSRTCLSTRCQLDLIIFGLSRASHTTLGFAHGIGCWRAARSVRPDPPGVILRVQLEATWNRLELWWAV